METTLLDSEDSIYEHIFHRYIDLESNTNSLRQDLGIQTKTNELIHIEFDPPECTATTKSKPRQTRRNRKNKNDAPLIETQKATSEVPNTAHAYHVELYQSITSLNSSKDNNNSTTGYVVWQTTPFFIDWLLYHVSDTHKAAPDTELLDLKEVLLNSNIIELGTGISPVCAIILSNYLNNSRYYVATDQKGILPVLKKNLTLNRNIIVNNKNDVVSSTLNWNNSREVSELSEMTQKKEFHVEVEPLDWELTTMDNTTPFVQKVMDDQETHSCTILAMDVIYNDFLIKPFLQTLETLFKKWKIKHKKEEIRAVIGVQLRAQEVVQNFILEAVLEFDFKVQVVQSDYLNSSRFCIYVISPAMDVL